METMDPTVTVQVNAQRLLETAARMFDGTTESLVLEIMQNGRRAGATRIDIDATDLNKLIIANDGAIIEDFAPMFSLGTTGWEDSEEDPAGAGFFSCMAAEKVIVRSGDRLVEVNKEILTTLGAEIEVQSSDRYVNGTEITLEGYSHDIRNSSYSSVSIFSSYPLPVYLNSLDYNLKPKLVAYDSSPYDEDTMPAQGIRYTYEEHGLYVDVSNSKFETRFSHIYSHHINYWGHVAPLPCYTYGLSVRVLPMHNTPCGIRMVLPSRNALIENDALEALVSELIPQSLAKYFRDVVGNGHKMSYEHWSKLAASTGVDIPEMAPITDVIPYKADGCDLVTSKPFLSEAYWGYSWNDHFPIAEVVAKNGKGELFPVTKTWATYCDDHQPIKLKLEKDNSLVSCPEILAYMEYNSGCTVSDSLLVNSERDEEFSDANILLEEIMCSWEASDDPEADSPYMQEEEYRSDLRNCLVRMTQGKEAADKSAVMSKVEQWNVYASCVGNYVGFKRSDEAIEIADKQLENVEDLKEYLDKLSEGQLRGILKLFSPVKES